ncbi:rCG30803 [Rattus norvegicus]|uniref:RCG30803 n=1 Tax=Rattus norvegicus TaxID=10116 RepID=A6ISZ5_RAT|nr:rCG30803 [Rattus norvegicus]
MVLPGRRGSPAVPAQRSLRPEDSQEPETRSQKHQPKLLTELGNKGERV